MNDSSDLDAADHRTEAVRTNGETWTLLERPTRTDAEDDELLSAAYASAYHWARAADVTPAHAARAAWLISRCHAVLGHGIAALHHADRSAAAVEAAGLDGFDLAYGHEARARALACLGRLDEAAAQRQLARSTPIAGDEDRRIFESDLAAAPWFGLPDS